MRPLFDAQSGSASVTSSVERSLSHTMNRDALSSLIVCALLVASCAGERQRSCKSDDDCADGEVCGGGICAASNASSNDDTVTDDVPADGECVEDGDACERHSECCGYNAFASVCVEYSSHVVVCSPRCERNADCANGCCVGLITEDVEGGQACAPSGSYCNGDCPVGCRIGDVCCGGSQCGGSCANSPCCTG
jgi:hypothetical protein